MSVAARVSQEMGVKLGNEVRTTCTCTLNFAVQADVYKTARLLVQSCHRNEYMG